MSQSDVEVSASEPGTSHFDIEASQPEGPMSQWAGAALLSVRPWVLQPYRGSCNPTMGPFLTVSPWAPSSPLLLCRRHRLSTCAGIGRIPPRLAAIGTSANSSSMICLDARAHWSETRTPSAQPTDEVPRHQP